MNLKIAIRAVTMLSMLLGFAGCLHPQAVPPSARTLEEWDIREAVFRYQLEKERLHYPDHGWIRYLAIGDGTSWDTDPPAELMKRFTDDQPPVKPASESRIWLGGVVHWKTGEAGELFKTGAIQWISETEVEVSGRYVIANLNSEGHRYGLSKLHGNWKVVRDDLLWISRTSPDRLSRFV